jgi:hypothetical protein
MAADGETLSTTDHDTIRAWAEARGGRPARPKGSDGIDLDFPGYAEDLDEISWEEWFRTFDERGLELQYQETTKDGTESNFNKLTSRT